MLKLGGVAAALLRGTLTVLLAAVVFVLTVTGGVAVRLAQGPLDVTAVAQWLARTEAPDTSFGQVTLGLERSDGGRLLRVDVLDARHPAEPGQTGGTVRHLQATLRLQALLEGELAPREVTADGVRGQWVRAATATAGAARPDLSRVLAGVRHLALNDAALDVVDGALGQVWHLQGLTAEATRGVDGVLAGNASATAAIGTVAAPVTADIRDAADGLQVHVTTGAVSPAALARAIPLLAPLAALDAPVSTAVDAVFDHSVTLRTASLHAQAGPGTLQLPTTHGTSPAQFAALSLDATGTPDAVTLRELRVVIAPPSGNAPSTLLLSGDAARSDGRFTAHLVAELDHAELADLPSLWPAGVGGGGRQWLTQNITAGNVHAGRFTLTLTGTQDGGDIDLAEAGGTMTGEDVAIWWLRPVPPAEHAHVTITWVDPDTLLIGANGARQGGIAVKTGSVRITGLAGHDQVALITVDLAGALGDVVALLRHPRLKLLSRHPIRIDAPSGAVSGQLTVRLPLESKVEIEQVAIHFAGGVAGAHLGGIAAGRDLDHGQLAIDVTNDGLTVSGPAQVDHVPAKLAVDMDFRAGPPGQVVQHAAAGLRLTEREARAAGLAALGLGAGVMLADIDYVERRDGGATLQLKADLTQAAFTTPLGWSKPVGAPGHVEGRALLFHGKLVGLEDLRADAPGLSVVARSELVGGRPSVVHLLRGEVGRSSATGTIVLPQRDGELYAVTLAGRQLDLEGRFKDATASSPARRDSGAGPPYAINLRFERVLLAPGRALGPVSLVAAGTGRHVTSAHLSVGGAARVDASISSAGGGRRVHVETADLGLLLRDTDVATDLDGGEFKLDAVFEDHLPGSPLAGTADLRNFKVRGLPIIGKVLQGVTLYGLVDALRGPGLAFDRLSAPFRLDGSVLDVTDARAFSSSLGVTATGRLDLGRQAMSVKGTVVPAYFFNSLPGRIPLVGSLFRTDKGSGLFAANYELHGALAAPSVSINPLSALAPGFTRRFFDLFD